MGAGELLSAAPGSGGRGNFLHMARLGTAVHGINGQHCLQGNARVCRIEEWTPKAARNEGLGQNKGQGGAKGGGSHAVRQATSHWTDGPSEVPKGLGPRGSGRGRRMPPPPVRLARVVQHLLLWPCLAAAAHVHGPSSSFAPPPVPPHVPSQGIGHIRTLPARPRMSAVRAGEMAGGGGAVVVGQACRDSGPRPSVSRASK